jgi:hypothetical protein
MRNLIKTIVSILLCGASFSVYAQSISISATHDSICSGTYVTFSAVATGSTTPHYSWYKNSVSVGVDSTGYTTNSINNGDVIICLLSNSVGGATIAISNTITETVFNNPIVSIIGGASTVCRNSTTLLTDSTAGGLWSSSNTAIATINASGTLSGVAVGLDTITYTVTNLCGSQSATKIITVIRTPLPGNIAGPANLCVGATNTVYIDTPAGGIWSSSNTATGTIDSIGNFSPLAAGNTNITYTMTNACGTVTRTRAVTVQGAPVAQPISGSTSVCQSDTIHLHDAAPGGQWVSSNSNIALVTGVGGGPAGGFGLVAGISAGSITVTYRIINNCGADSTTAIITINPLPVVYPITGGDSVCAEGTLQLNDITPGGSWASSNMSAATVDANGLVSGLASGSSDITYSVTNSCGTTTQTQTVTIGCPTAVNNVIAQNITIYPNPAHNMIAVEGAERFNFRIINLLGECVKTAQNTNQLSISELANGIYFLQLIDTNGTIVLKQKIVKE